LQAVALEQDNRIIYNNMEATSVEGSHTLDSGLNFDLANVDETHAAWEIKNQEILDVDMVSHTLDSGLNSDLANVDETHAAWEIKNQEILDVDMVSMAAEYMP